MDPKFEYLLQDLNTDTNPQKLIEKGIRLGKIQVNFNKVIWSDVTGYMTPSLYTSAIGSPKRYHHIGPAVGQELLLLGLLRDLKYGSDLLFCPYCNSKDCSKQGQTFDRYPSYLCHNCGRIFHQCPEHGTNTPGTNIYCLDEGTKAVEPERVTCTCGLSTRNAKQQGKQEQRMPTGFGSTLRPLLTQKLLKPHQVQNPFF